MIHMIQELFGQTLSDGWRGISKRDAMISRPCASAAHTAADDAAATGFGQCVT
jgi:hypothetical protein